MIELVLIATRGESILIGKHMQQLRQPPRKTLGSPDATQRCRGIRLKIAVMTTFEVSLEAAMQVVDVRNCEIEALGPGRRHDMSGVPGEEQPAMTHRLGDEASQRGDGLLDRGTRDDLVGQLLREPRLQLLPKPFVGLCWEIGVRRTLDVVARQLRRAL
jgi:hypothetical protein